MAPSGQPSDLHTGWIGVLGGPDLWAQAPATLYIEELFAQAGLLNWRWLASPDELDDASVRVAVVPNGRLVGDASVESVRRFVEGGGRLLVLGRPGPLAELFNVVPQPPVREGWLVPGEGLPGPLAGRFPVPLHVFDLVHLLPGPGAGMVAGAIDFSIGNHQVHWPISARASLGRGEALLVAADLPASIVRIQQGLTIYHDGQSAPDGSAAIDDGILKCEDGMVLDWSKDRQQPVDAAAPVFLQPQSDLLRELLLALVLALADAAGLAVPILGVWPRGLSAVGLISHNSDLNEPDKADRELAADAEADLAATWCLMSGGLDGVQEYPPQVLARIAASGHEIALRFDAQSGPGPGRWGPEALRAQLQRLRERLRAVAIQAPVYSNKNYYCRWEGRLEMFRWLAAAGVRVDQSKGPTKSGLIGWPFGSCHPWRPLDDEVSPPYLLDLLEISFASPDIGGYSCRPELGRLLIDAAVARGGVAHLTFHPWQADRDDIRRQLLAHVAYGRERGLEWWTSRRIGDWQFARRAARLAEFSIAGGQAVLKLDAPLAMEGATVDIGGAGVGTSIPADLSGPVELSLGCAPSSHQGR